MYSNDFRSNDAVNRFRAAIGLSSLWVSTIGVLTVVLVLQAIGLNHWFKRLLHYEAEIDGLIEFRANLVFKDRDRTLERELPLTVGNPLDPLLVDWSADGVARTCQCFVHTNPVRSGLLQDYHLIGWNLAEEYGTGSGVAVNNLMQSVTVYQTSERWEATADAPGSDYCSAPPRMNPHSCGDKWAPLRRSQVLWQWSRRSEHLQKPANQTAFAFPAGAGGESPTSSLSLRAACEMRFSCRHQLNCPNVASHSLIPGADEVPPGSAGAPPPPHTPLPCSCRSVPRPDGSQPAGHPADRV